MKKDADQDAPDDRERDLILVVDDEEIVRSYLAAALEMSGFRVESVTDGNEALRFIEAHPVDAIIADCFLPGMNGRDLHDVLERRGHPLAARMVFVSGNTGDEAIAEFLARTGAPSLQKPFRPQELRDALVDLLADRPRGES